MQWHKIFSVAFLVLILSACGDGVEGGAVVEDSITKEDVVVVASPAEAGVPSYFTYIGASQSWIAIQGTGGVGRNESSVITFKLLDKNGDAVSGVGVNFTLVGPSGSELEPASGVTDDSGSVSTTVTAGKVSGSVRVRIATSDGGIKNISDILSISTGIPDQNSFSLSVENLAPEAWEYDGVQVGATIRLADHFNNAVPDGTSVYFTTEGGAIRDAETGTVGSCVTVGSKCTLTWESQAPRPEGNMLSDGATCADSTVDFFAPCITATGMGQPYGGRVTITAFAVGEESFTDNNADGWFNTGDALLKDLPEVFYDHNEDGYYKTNALATNIGDGEEEFHDFAPIDQAYSPADGKYTGLLCASEAESLDLCSSDLINVRANTAIIMASGNQYFRVRNTGSDTNSVDLTSATGSGSASLQIYVADIFNNRPPTGSTISVETDNGVLSGKTTWVVADSNSYGPFIFSITLTRETEGNDKTSGIAMVTVTSPAGLNSTYPITVSDDG